MATLTCISSMATRQLLQVLCARWGDLSGQRVQLESVGGVDAARRIEAGEPFALAVLASDALQKLAASGHIGRITPIAVSDVAIAARAGTAPPVATRAQLLETLQQSRAIGYSTGPSGKALLARLAHWGVLDSLQARLVQAPPGVAVGDLIAQGAVDLGFQQHSELIHCQNIALLGPMPVGDEISTVFAAAPCTAGTQAEQSAEFIAYLCSAHAAEVIRREGMAPAAALPRQP